MMRKSEVFGGIRFDHYSMSELLDLLFQSVPDNLKMVITPNVDHIVRAQKKQELKPLYNSADICVLDSRVLKNLTSFIGLDLGNVIPGSDLTRFIVEKIAGKETPVTVIGCNEDSINKVRLKYDLRKVHHYNPPMGFINDEAEVENCIQFILEHPSSFLFLAVGSPQQEILAQKAKEAGSSGYAFCIGASFLFLSGEEVRAPVIMQKLSLEWLFRLIQSPGRLAKRYLIDGMAIFPLLFNEKRGRK